LADLITTIPWDAIAVSATHHDPDSLEGRYMGLLALLKLGRLYRLALLFRQMTYDLEHSLLVTTFLRNGSVSTPLRGGGGSKSEDASTDVS
jgi:hypothetical protein